MIRLMFAALWAMLLIFWLSPAWAEIPERFSNTDDTISVEREGAVYIITYSNSVENNSPHGTHQWEEAGIAFSFFLEVSGVEVLTIEPPAGYVAEPPTIEVRDGDEGVIILSPLMF